MIILGRLTVKLMIGKKSGEDGPYILLPGMCSTGEGIRQLRLC